MISNAKSKGVPAMSPMKKPAGSGKQHLGATISLGAAARRLHITRREVRRLLGSGRLNFVQICGRLRVPLREVKRFANTKV